MRVITTHTTVYTFDELSDDAKDKAIDKLGSINVDYDWWDCIYDDAATIGLKIESFDIDRRSYCKGKWTKDAKEVAESILKEHGESCETHKDAVAFLTEIAVARSKFEQSDIYDPEYQEYEDSSEYEDASTEFYRTICEDYRIILRKEYEYLMSREAIVETIKANEYEFTINGILA